MADPRSTEGATPTRPQSGRAYLVEASDSSTSASRSNIAVAVSGTGFPGELLVYKLSNQLPKAGLKTRLYVLSTTR